jgi:prepilin-type N-terminal cleavage/methylation domain-containing protein
MTEREACLPEPVMMRRSNRGFTLIELAVVMVVIGILVAITLPNLAQMTVRAKLAGVRRTMHVVQVTVEDYATRNFGQYPANALAVTADGGLRFDQVLPGSAMPENPFTFAPTVLDWSNVAGSAPVTDAAGGVSLNVSSSSVAGPWDTYDVLGEDDTGALLSLVLRNR